MSFQVLKTECVWCGEFLGGDPDAPKSHTSHGFCRYCAEAVLAELEPSPSHPVWGQWVVLGGEG